MFSYKNFLGKDDGMIKNPKIEHFLAGWLGDADRIRFKRWYIDRINSVCDPDKVMEMSADELTDLLIQTQPNSITEVRNLKGSITKYAEFYGNKEFVKVAKQVDPLNVWVLYCESGTKKQRFISKHAFDELIQEFQMAGELNSEYRVALLRCIYEGVWSDDWSVIINLRGSDVHGNVVTVRPDGRESFDLTVSDELAESLVELSRMNYTERQNRFGMFSIQTFGKYHDTCFKLENRKDKEIDRKQCYWRECKKVYDVVGFEPRIKPRQLYVSGLIYKVKEELEKNGIALEQVFVYKGRHKVGVEIVNKVMEQHGYPYSYVDLSKMVVGHVNSFY